MSIEKVILFHHDFQVTLSLQKKDRNLQCNIVVILNLEYSSSHPAVESKAVFCSAAQTVKQ